MAGAMQHLNLNGIEMENFARLALRIDACSKADADHAASALTLQHVFRRKLLGALEITPFSHGLNRQTLRWSRLARGVTVWAPKLAWQWLRRLESRRLCRPLPSPRHCRARPLASQILEILYLRKAPNAWDLHLL